MTLQRVNLLSRTLLLFVHWYWDCSIFWQLWTICCSFLMTWSWFFEVCFWFFTWVRGLCKDKLEHSKGLLKVHRTAGENFILSFALSFWVFRSFFPKDFPQVQEIRFHWDKAVRTWQSFWFLQSPELVIDGLSPQWFWIFWRHPELKLRFRKGSNTFRPT